MIYNPFTKHAKENGHSGYFSHLTFAFPIAIRLLICSSAFALHCFLPFIPLPKFLNLEMTIQYLIKKNLDTL
tara:strand:- start:4848 stop:5063 length:216 start_codon:yes stop_codon:yes gene_type:complete